MRGEQDEAERRRRMLKLRANEAAFRARPGRLNRWLADLLRWWRAYVYDDRN